MHSVNFLPIWLGKVPKDADFSEVVHSTFRYQNFLIFNRESAENRFRRKFYKFKFFNYKQIYGCFRGKKGPWFRIFSFRDIRNYRSIGIYRILTGNSGRNFFIAFLQTRSLIPNRKKGFRGRWFRIFRFPLYLDYGFKITAKIPNLPGNFGRNFFFAFRLIEYHSRFRRCWF